MFLARSYILLCRLFLLNQNGLMNIVHKNSLYISDICRYYYVSILYHKSKCYFS